MMKKIIFITNICIFTAICIFIAHGQRLTKLVRAAEQGDTTAAFELAIAYQKGGRIAGRRVFQDDVLAIKYAALAGQQGLPIVAQYIDTELGHTPEDILTDRRLRTMSTALAKYTQDPISRYLLGAAYYLFDPGARQEGIRLLKEGADVGDEKCMFIYAQALRDQGNFEGAIKLFKKLPTSAEQKFHLGNTYVKQGNRAKGLKLIERAALQGYAPAQNFLGTHVAVAQPTKAVVEQPPVASKPVEQSPAPSSPSPLPSNLTFNVAPTGVGNTSTITLNVSPQMFADQARPHRSPDMDVLLEFKVAYFLSTDTAFNNMYGKGGVLWGPELTVKLHKRLFGWISVDFFSKHGSSLRNGMSSCAGISTCCQVLTHNCYPTSVTFIPLAIGLKYFVPFATARKSLTGDFYVGLGVEPTYFSSSSSACAKHTAVGVGGIVKVGAYLELSQNLFLDLFADYSFVSVDDNEPRSRSNCTTNLSGFIFGAGLGYRFN